LTPAAWPGASSARATWSRWWKRPPADFDQAEAEKTARKLAKGQFDLEDLANQLRQLQKMGGMQGIMGLLPGVQKVKKQLGDMNVGDKVLKRQEAIITSMTPAERKKPDVLNASRKRRIAAGAGVDVAEVNRLLKQHRQMADAFKAMSRDGGKGMARMAQAMGMQMPGQIPGMGGGGGMPAGAGPDLSRLKALGGGRSAEPDPSSPPAGLPGLPGMGGGGLPGLGAGFPGLPGFKKK
jgi:signal recognition particle subunit SRP54